MSIVMHCLLINYDGGSQPLLRQYIHRSGCQEITPTAGPMGYPTDLDWWQACDLVFLHLTDPDEMVRDDLAAQLMNHPGVVITSPFPKHQFPNLRIRPFAFLTEPFSLKKFTECVAAYRQETHKKI